MEEKLKIKLSIADRVYPLTIDPKQEEGLRKAAKNIDFLARKFEQNYAHIGINFWQTQHY